MSPFIEYFELVVIANGQKGGTARIVAIIMASSPTWFDWFLLGTLIALFWGLSDANQTLLLQCVFHFPLFRLTPSV